jgi:hypothetical protein
VGALALIGSLACLSLSSVSGQSSSAQQPSARPSDETPPVKLSGYLQAREVYQSHVGLTSTINRARLAASGSTIRALTWHIQGEFRTGSVGTGKASVSLQDAYLRYGAGAWAVQAGQFKTPFAREFITSLADVETADRSTVVDSLAPKRDIGAMAELVAGRRANLYLGVFNGEGQNVISNTDSTVLGVGRLVIRPIPLFALGINGARYFGDSTRYGADANYEGRRVTFRAEYVGQHRDGSAGPDDWGWYGLGAVFLVDAVQVVGKYEEFGRPDIDTRVKNRALTAGINLYPGGRNFRLTLDYVSRKIGDPGTRKGRVLAQAQAKF